MSNQFVIVNLAEVNGEATLTVEKAKELRAVYEAKNRIRPNAQNTLALACIYFTLGMAQEALTAIELVLQSVKGRDDINPAVLSTALMNYAMILRSFGRFDEAYIAVTKSWSLNKFDNYNMMAMAEEHLRKGEWEQGWKLHNKSRGTAEGGALALGLPDSVKFWDGKETPELLFVINEGGAGDRINYTRYLPELTKRGINWKFFCFDEFAPFYERLEWIGKDRLILESDRTEFSPYPTHWTTPFSLAGPLGITSDTIPNFPTPYTAPESKLTFIRTSNTPIVGISWTANELFQGGLKIRSLSEGQAMRLVSKTDDLISWVNVQHAQKLPYPVANVPFYTWQDTATLIDKLDAMVSVDCGSLWLATAMNKPTAVLLSSNEDWKFQSTRNGSHCIWSPTATLYHNGPSQVPHDMEHAIDLLINDIRSGNWPKTSTPVTRTDSLK